LRELIHRIRRLWTPPPPPKLPTRPTMIIPTIADVRNCTQAEKVQSQCRECSKLLAPHLYVWHKPFPEKPTVKRWNPDSLSFTGMDLNLFAGYLMQQFTLKTADGKEWLLDRSIAALIWAECTDEGSPLPEASWEVEMAFKRKAVR
jgi:hypothetical protein